MFPFRFHTKPTPAAKHIPKGNYFIKKRSMLWPLAVPQFRPFIPSQSIKLQILGVSLPCLAPFFVTEDLQVSSCSHL